MEMLYLFFTFLIGIVFVVGGTEGYIYGLGTLGKVFSFQRILSFVGGFLFIIPNMYTKIIGLFTIGLLFFTVYFNREKEKPVINATQIS
jgi:TRAP-type uncharacterized transport system fused permease subunit